MQSELFTLLKGHLCPRVQYMVSIICMKNILIIITALWKHYGSQAKIRNITEIEKQLRRTTIIEKKSQNLLFCAICVICGLFSPTFIHDLFDFLLDIVE